LQGAERVTTAAIEVFATGSFLAWREDQFGKPMVASQIAFPDLGAIAVVIEQPISDGRIELERGRDAV
jgi:hypothetical protein